MTGFKRSLTLFDMTMIAIGGSIGSGHLSHARDHRPRRRRRRGSSSRSGCSGGLITLAGALTFSEAAALLPEAGGQYVYLTRAYGGLVGFLFGWAYFVVVNAGGLGRPEPSRSPRTSGSSSRSAPSARRSWPLSSLLLLSGVNVRRRESRSRVRERVHGAETARPRRPRGRGPGARLAPPRPISPCSRARRTGGAVERAGARHGGRAVVVRRVAARDVRERRSQGSRGGRCPSR